MTLERSMPAPDLPPFTLQAGLPHPSCFIAQRSKFSIQKAPCPRAQWPRRRRSPCPAMQERRHTKIPASALPAHPGVRTTGKGDLPDAHS